MPAFDVLDPGPGDSFPNLPRTEEGCLDVERMAALGVRLPVGEWVERGGQLIDLTPTVRLSDGRLVKITELVPVEPPAETPTTEGTPDA